jgi:hypothetical protein
MTSPLPRSIPSVFVLALLLPSAALANDAATAALFKDRGDSVRLDQDGNITGLTVRGSEKLTDDDYRRIADLKKLRQLTFYGTCLMTDDQAATLSTLPALEELAANATRLTDDGFQHIAKLAALRKLTIWHLGWQNDKKTTGAGFAALAALPRLESFNFSGSTVTDDGLAAVAMVTQLRELTMYHCWFSDAGLAHIKAMTNLRSVTVGPQFSMRITDAGVKTLAQLPNLESLDVKETMLTWDGSLAALAASGKLKTIRFEKVAIRDGDLAKLKAALPQAKIELTPPTEKDLEQMRKALERRSK